MHPLFEKFYKCFAIDIFDTVEVQKVLKLWISANSACRLYGQISDILKTVVTLVSLTGSQKFVGLGIFFSKSYLQNNHMKAEEIINLLKMKSQLILP